jgi:hypothetical protein
VSAAHGNVVAKGKCIGEQIQSGKAILHETVSLVVGLIRSISPDCLHEKATPYGIGAEGIERNLSEE